MHKELSPPTVVALHSGSGTIRAHTDPRNNKQQGLKGQVANLG